MILKTLIIWIRCVSLRLELNCVDLWPSRNWVWDQWCKLMSIIGSNVPLSISWGMSNKITWNGLAITMSFFKNIIYIYAFSRRFYPKRLTIAFRLYIFISMCVPWESNPQPFALLTQCSTTEPHRNTHIMSCGSTYWAVNKFIVSLQSSQ